MRDVERLQAAINKLETLRAGTSQGVWVADSMTGHIYADAGRGEGVAFDMTDETAALIVTLHRTINAQLAILLCGRAIFYSDFQTPTSPQLRDAANALADAILGEP